MRPTRRAISATLDAASAALQQGDLHVAAVQLREVWRATREPALAQLYEALVDSGPHASLSGSDAEARAQAFRERAQTAAPLELPALLAEPWSPALDELERLRLLHAWTPDPLLASALARRLRLPLVPDWSAGLAQLRGATVRLLAAQRDPRQLDTLEQLRAKPGLGAELRRQLRGAIASLSSTKVFRLDASLLARSQVLARRGEQQRAVAAEQRALLAAIHDAPDDDAPRLVYADWLDARGDPRGEFITLQLQLHGDEDGDRATAGERSEGAAAHARVRALLDANGARWAGDLHGVLGSRTRAFERGFLARASIEAQELEGEILDAHAWTTLRSLDGHVPEQLLARARLDHLRELYGFLSLERFVSLRAAGRLQAVDTYECSIADPNLRFDTPLGLRRLLVRTALDPQLRALLASPAVAGLEELGVYYLVNGQSWVGDHRERLGLRARVQLLRAHLPAHIERVRMLDQRSSRASCPEGYELLFERGHAGQPLGRVHVGVHPFAERLSGVCSEDREAITRELQTLEVEVEVEEIA